MEIKDLQQKITKLEKDIHKLINEFETTTNTSVSELDLQQSILFRSRLTQVTNVNIRVDI